MTRKGGPQSSSALGNLPIQCVQYRPHIKLLVFRGPRPVPLKPRLVPRLQKTAGLICPTDYTVNTLPHLRSDIECRDSVASRGINPYPMMASHSKYPEARRSPILFDEYTKGKGEECRAAATFRDLHISGSEATQDPPDGHASTTGDSERHWPSQSNIPNKPQATSAIPPHHLTFNLDPCTTHSSLPASSPAAALACHGKARPRKLDQLDQHFTADMNCPPPQLVGLANDMVIMACSIQIGLLPSPSPPLT
ncbi:2935_t:CDS:2 [Acaulospora colombiana]|uniref:2935_t:CDS:1 n=1 Tax=Acaulospora colombiana TaxID=27376 RepID=A0ACA9MV58_9GLOM|nr:2935_t:CDS:2 [Acaulospora colombiana]